LKLLHAGASEAESANLTVKGACVCVKKENKKLAFLMSAGSKYVLARSFVKENMPETLADSRININLPQNLAKTIAR
jgi:hypothetical protein